MKNDLCIEFVLPKKVRRTASFPLPILITNTTEKSVIEELSGKIQLGGGLTLKPPQREVIHFGHLDPGQRIVLTWILFSEGEGDQQVHIDVHAKGNLIATRSIQLTISH